MLDMQKNITFYGRSVGDEVTETGEKVVWATMDASISNEGQIHINKYTMSRELYAAHADEIEADWLAFEAEVNKYAQMEMVAEETEA